MNEVRKNEDIPSLPRKYMPVSFLIGIGLAYLIGRLNGGIFTAISQNMNWGAVPYGGLISFGSILGGLLYGFLLSKIFKLSTGKTLDLIALILPMMESIYRIGCIMMGCCFGRETDGFLGVHLPEVHGVWARRYPTQIALLVFNLLLFLFLWRRSKKEHKAGSQTAIFLIFYSAGRFVIDSFRGDMPMIGAMGYHQIISLAIFCSTILFELGRRFFQQKEKHKGV